MVQRPRGGDTKRMQPRPRRRRRGSDRPAAIGGPGHPLRHRTAYVLICFLLLFIVTLLPFAVVSLVEDLRDQPHAKHAIAALIARPVDRASVAMDLISMDEWLG